MAAEGMILILSRLAFGAIATFLAIILWSQTRDTAWMFIVIGTIVGYGEVVFSTLERFGVVDIDAVEVYGVSVFRIVFANLPTIFYSIAFLIMVMRKRIR